MTDLKVLQEAQEVLLPKRHSVEKRVDGKYIYFWHDSKNDNPKTEVWAVISKEDNDWLGRISWSGRWRCYKFSSTFKACGKTNHGCFVSNVDFEHRCLRDIADFIEKLTKEERSTWKK